MILVVSEGQHSAVELICYAWLSDLSDAIWFESYSRDETEFILFFNLTSRYQSGKSAKMYQQKKDKKLYVPRIGLKSDSVW